MFSFFRIRKNNTGQLLGLYALNSFLAPLTLAKVASKIYSTSTKTPNKTWPYAILFWGLFLSFILFCLLQIKLDGSWAIAIFAYFCFCGCTARLRMKTRERINIPGNLIEDFLCSLIMYPSVAVQLSMTVDALVEAEKKSKSCAFDSVV